MVPPPRTVLVCNDDGPPGDESPFINSFVTHLRETLGWNVIVCIPARQQSWVGKALTISGTIEVTYWDPKLGERRSTGRSGDWTLVDASPASCINIALTHLYPTDDIDLIISGPNYGRNASTASTLSSGTIGAALDASLLGKKAIALSFAFYDRAHSKSRSHIAGACGLATATVKRVWEFWATPEAGTVDVVNVNVPLVEVEHGMQVPMHLTQFAAGGYGVLYKPVVGDSTTSRVGVADGAVEGKPVGDRESLKFVFRPVLSLSGAPEGTDLW